MPKSAYCFSVSFIADLLRFEAIALISHLEMFETPTARDVNEAVVAVQMELTEFQFDESLRQTEFNTFTLIDL